MSYGRQAKGSRCKVRKVRVTDKSTGVIRDTFEVTIQCGKGRKKAEAMRFAIDGFLRSLKAGEAPMMRDIRRVVREEVARNG